MDIQGQNVLSIGIFQHVYPTFSHHGIFQLRMYFLLLKNYGWDVFPLQKFQVYIARGSIVAFCREIF